MKIRPKRYAVLDGLRMIHGPGGSEGPRRVVECEVVAPPSSEGRTVYLMLDDADVVDLLLDLRDAAVEARR
jgi:hypothetical protein